MYKYQHGGDIYSEKATSTGKTLLDFSANINPFGLPLGVRDAIVKSINQCVNYPDAFCRELRVATAEFLGVSPDYLFFGNGAADVLFRLTLAVKPRKALLLAPTFADYEKALRAVGCEVELYKLDRESFLVKEDILEKINPSLDMLVICNPNNPTGLLCRQELLKAILNRCQACGTLMLLDECFMDFVPPEQGYSFKGYIEEYLNLVILKAFTKTFAMPGVRLGYCLTANEEIILGLHGMGQDWNVSILAQEAGVAALKEKQYLQDSFTYIQKEREFMLHNLSKLPSIRIWPSIANFIFFKLRKPPLNFAENLKEEGFLIRFCANYHNLGNNYYRIAVKRHEDNVALLEAMERILSK